MNDQRVLLMIRRRIEEGVRSLYIAYGRARIPGSLFLLHAADD